MLLNAFSFILVATGGVLLLGSTYLFHAILTLGLQLRENSYLETLWHTNPMPLYLDFYMFNWTNPEEIHTPGVKPHFTEVGPFSFNEVRTKGNLTWNQNGTVSYRQYHTYNFNRERSVADLSHPITTLNAIMVALAHKAKVDNFNFWLRKGLQVSFNQFGQKLAVTKPFGNYIFEGYEDPLVAVIDKLPIKSPLDSKMAWFYNRNGTAFGGVFNIGAQFHNFGRLEQWNYSNRTPHFGGSCGELKETTLEFHRAYRGRSISIFVPDMCRSIPMDFEEEVDVEGILGWKYTAGERFLDNGTLYPENRCYCPGTCPPSGAVNISSCKYDVPAFTSLPNYYLADDFYRNGVEGLKPDASKHEMYIILEPITGAILRVCMRMQVSLYLEPVQYISMFEKVPTVMIPLLWFEEAAQVPDFMLTAVKITLLIPTILKILGAILILIGLYLYTRRRKAAAPKTLTSKPITAEPSKQAHC